MSRHVASYIRSMLWGRAAGRCEFRDCNLDLTRHPGTKESVNTAEVAHIIGFSEDGPRGEKDLSARLARDLDNLMLLCGTCHKTVDTNRDKYPVALLREMKTEHEERIAVVGATSRGRRSHVVLFGARVGEHNSPLSFARVAPALSPDWYPADTSGIALGIPQSSERDSDEFFWNMQVRNIQRLIDSRIKAAVEAGTINHLSIFAIAPQPLLIVLGYLLSDLVPAEVYQLRREPPIWSWDRDSGEEFDFIVERPNDFDGPPALVIGTTDRIADNRVWSVLPNAILWRITVSAPHSDVIRSRYHLRKFREVVRPLLDEIKNNHGMDKVIHIFPATAVSTAVELGRCIQPKVTPPIRIYDTLSPSRGFAPVLTLPL